MTIQFTNTVAHDVPLSTLLTEFAGLEEVYMLVEDTQHLLGTVSTLTQLTGDASFTELSIPLCPWHAAAIEDLTQLAVASMEQRVAGMEQRVEEMKQRIATMEQHLEELERQLAGTERTLDHIDEPGVDGPI